MSVISEKPISRSRILIHFTFFSLGQSVEKIDPATGVTDFGLGSQLLDNAFLDPTMYVSFIGLRLTKTSLTLINRTRL